MASVISEAELVDALVAAMQRPDAPSGALTVAEYAALTGWHRARVQKAIGKLAMQDRVEVHRKNIPSIDGRPNSRPAYKILPPKKRGKR